MFTLIVTWLVFNQAPYGYQTAFGSAQACEHARQQVLAEGRRLAEENRSQGEARAVTIPSGPGGFNGSVTTSGGAPPPQVSAICVRR